MHVHEKGKLVNIRVWKAVFTAIFGLLALAYAVQNVMNLDGGMYASFAYVLSRADHAAYPESIVPAIVHPALIWASLILVLLLEFAAGLLMSAGAWQMWRHRMADGDTFLRAKRHAINGVGVAILVWFLLFGVFGAALWQMWQTAIGSGSYNGAFQFSVYGLLLFGLLSMRD